MTASLPLPDEQPADSDAHDGVQPAAARAPRTPRTAASKGSAGAKSASGTKSSSGARSASGTKKPSPKPRTAASKPRAPRAVPTQPGPPPPLPADVISPADIVIPPKPPLPADLARVEEADVEPEPEAVVEPEPLVEPEAAVEPDPVVDAPPVVPADPASLVVIMPDADSASETDAETPALVLRAVTKTFGETLAVDAIDLTVPAGSFYGLVGPNGAGKTTTLSMIAGLLRPDSGTIEVGGIDANRRRGEAQRRMGVLPDRLRTFDRLTGRQLLYYYGVLRGLPAAVAESRTDDLARAFDLVEALGRPVSDYSAGMTKKVMLAGAMIHAPRVLVLDEPFEAVDPVSSAVILDILSTYVDNGGTVILSSHGMQLVERVCTRVAVLVSGKVLAEGTVDDVRGPATLEERFLELVGGRGDLEGLEWLHTFSD